MKIAVVSFGRGFTSFLLPWNCTYTPSKRQPRSIERYFVNVGGYLSKAVQDFAEKHPEIPVHAN